MNLQRNKASQPKLMESFNMTPMIDLVFLLLIFFLLTSSYMLQTGIRVDLPKAKEVKTTVEQELTITITKEKDIFVNDEQVSLLGLEEVLVEKAKKLDHKRVVIKPDTNLDTGSLIKVMDIAKEAGFESFGIATWPEKGEEKKT